MPFAINGNYMYLRSNFILVKIGETPVNLIKMESSLVLTAEKLTL